MHISITNSLTSFIERYFQFCRGKKWKISLNHNWYLIIQCNDKKDISLVFFFFLKGAGTAGCVLAGLSENPEMNVLLIEAERIFGPLAMVPLFTSQQQRTSVDWQSQTTSQKYSSFGLIDQVSQMASVVYLLNISTKIF